MPRWMTIENWGTADATIAIGPSDGFDEALAAGDAVGREWMKAAERAEVLDLLGALEATSARRAERKLWARLCREVQSANGYRVELALSATTASTLPAVLRAIGGGR